MRRNLLAKYEVSPFDCPECGAGYAQPCRGARGQERDAFHRARWDHAEQAVRTALSVLARREKYGDSDPRAA